MEGSDRRDPTLGTLLLIAVVLAGAMASLAPLFEFVEGRLVPGAVTLLVLGAAVALGVRRAAGRRSRAAAVLLLLLSVVVLLVPANGGAALLLIVLAVGVMALDVGLAAAIVGVLLLSSAQGLQGVLRYGSDLVSAVAQSVVLTLVLLMACLVGRLLRRLDDTRRQLETANEALRRSLSRERELVLAEERARSARELHDGLGHRLTLISMSLEYARRMRDRAGEEAWAEVATAAAGTRQVLDELRLWARALSPAEVADAAGLEAIAASFRGTGLDVSVRHRGDSAALGRDASLFATRFVQEGLTNVLRHAGAGRVEIEVLQSPERLRVTIGDDGAGVPAGAPDAGFGLRSLRERAELLGGELLSGASPLGGFQLVAVVPAKDGS